MLRAISAEFISGEDMESPLRTRLPLDADRVAPRTAVLAVLVLLSSAFCWWPIIMRPNLDLPFWWPPLTIIALAAGFATFLSHGGRIYITAAPVLGTFAGAVSGFLIWPPTDRIEGSFVPVVVVSAVLASFPISLVAGLVSRGVKLSNDRDRRAVWVALICCAALGPMTALLTPPLVALRVARNDRLAAERMASLSRAALQTTTETGDPQRICDRSTLKSYYSGPPFRERDWQYIAGNYVRRDGYMFGIYCYQGNGYAIDARPDREQGDGTKKFCADETGTIGCGMEWTGSRRRCTPCVK
jgi:hypothetical protein